MSDWIRRLKFAHAWTFGPWLGRKLAERIPDLESDLQSIVVPVPLHWTRRIMRGYNQSELIARQFARHRQWPMVPVLKRIRRTRPQSLLTPAQRRGNVRNCFELAPVDLTGWRIWLVDDVKTTGSTLRECCRLLRRAGAAEIMLVIPAIAGGNTPTRPSEADE
ncbi:MAG: ComF family protein [Phycisphaeraceae bacterium]|nr:ComF family protein [Phycisphaeraceae bacterium]